MRPLTEFGDEQKKPMTRIPRFSFAHLRIIQRGKHHVAIEGELYTPDDPYEEEKPPCVILVTRTLLKTALGYWVRQCSKYAGITGMGYVRAIQFEPCPRNWEYLRPKKDAAPNDPWVEQAVPAFIVAEFDKRCGPGGDLPLHHCAETRAARNEAESDIDGGDIANLLEDAKPPLIKHGEPIVLRTFAEVPSSGDLDHSTDWMDDSLKRFQR
jgi:hypothetical protein